jgi:hypothetical protein
MTAVGRHADIALRQGFQVQQVRHEYISADRENTMLVYYKFKQREHSEPDV